MVVLLFAPSVTLLQLGTRCGEVGEQRQSLHSLCCFQTDPNAHLLPGSQQRVPVAGRSRGWRHEGVDVGEPDTAGQQERRKETGGGMNC